VHNHEIQTKRLVGKKLSVTKGRGLCIFTRESERKPSELLYLEERGRQLRIRLID